MQGSSPIRAVRAAVVPIAILALGLITAPVTLAAAPSNDASTNATVLTSFPVHQTVDLSEATLEGGEPWCGGHLASVWYRYIPPAEQSLTISVSATESAARVCVLPDSIGAGTYRYVQPSETVTMLIDSGRTYFILLGTADPAAPATLDLAVGPPYFDLMVTLDSAVADHVSGAAIVGGMLSCSGPADVFLQARVQEKVSSKRFADASDYRYPIACSTTPIRWQITLHSNTAFVPGPATVTITAGGGDDSDQFTRTVKLGAK